MSATPGRIVCPRCGANNFQTQAACWKCGAGLTAGGVAASTPAAPAPGITPAVAPPTAVDPAVAHWSAVTLALLFPWVAVPAGLIFLMLDDRRKAQIGKITLAWGLAATLLHLLVTAWLVRVAVGQARGLLTGGGIRTAAPMRPGDPAPPLGLPEYSP